MRRRPRRRQAAAARARVRDIALSVQAVIQGLGTCRRAEHRQIGRRRHRCLG